MRLLLAFILLAVATGGLYGQTFGEIAGEVKDSTGASVPGANVTLTNLGTNATRAGVTNDSGLFDFPSLAPGLYSVRVERQGFRPVVQSNVQLQVQQTARVDFTMQVGEVGQTIEVNSTAPPLNTDDATIGTVIENKRIEDLPLNGRDFLQLVALSPNVSSALAPRARRRCGRAATGPMRTSLSPVNGERRTTTRWTV